MKDVVAFIVDLVLNVGVYVVVLGIAALFSWATDNGYWPENPGWQQCTTAPSGYAPCVMEDGSLMANINGRTVIYPKEGE